jgi:putative endonuclease
VKEPNGRGVLDHPPQCAIAHKADDDAERMSRLDRAAQCSETSGMRPRHFYVYILAGKIGGTLYIGVTNDLIRRVAEHRLKLVESFTEKYDVAKLVYYEQFDDAENAIKREKRLKKWNRAWKIRLIEENNPNWEDLYSGIAGAP